MSVISKKIDSAKIRSNSRNDDRISNSDKSLLLTEKQNVLLWDAIDALAYPLYIVDANSYVVKVANTAAVTNWRGEKKVCYKLIYGRSRSCDSLDRPCPVELVKKKKETVVLEVIDRDIDDDLRTYEVHGDPIFDGHGNVSHVLIRRIDISNHKRAEGKLRVSEERYRSLVETIDEWIWEIDASGVYTYVSPRIRDLLGYKPEELLGKKPFDLMPPEEAKRVADVFHEIAAKGKPFTLLENANIHKNGHIVLLATSGQPFFSPDGTLQGYRGIDRDVTERRRVERMMQQQASELAEKVKEQQCLYTIKKLLQNSSKPIDVTFNEVVEIIPQGFRDQGTTTARITLLGDKSYTTAVFAESDWKLSAPIKTGNVQVGLIEVFRVEEQKEHCEEPFLQWERDLISVVAGILSRLLERVTTEKARREAEEKFRAISSSAQNSIIMIDHEGKINYWNDAAERIFGYSRKEVIGKDYHQLLASTKRQQATRQGIEQFIKSGKGKVLEKVMELTALRKDGTEFPIEISISPINLESGWQAIAMVRDITEKQRSRQQLMQSEKMAGIGTLAAGVAHEINNPMGFIGSNLNTMYKYLKMITKYVEEIDGQDKGKQESIIELMVDFSDAIAESLEGADRVKKIVADLKSFSRVDRAEVEDADLNEGLESTLSIVWNELKYKCKVEKEFGDLPVLHCIPNQLNQVFMNLLMNASQAITEDSGLINIKTWVDEENIYVSIKDNGSGIPEANLNKLFEPFFTTKEVGKGTGLGLSLAYDIVKKHKGTIDVKSKVGVGTEFIIGLPLEGIDGD